MPRVDANMPGSGGRGYGANGKRSSVACTWVRASSLATDKYQDKDERVIDGAAHGVDNLHEQV